MNETRQNIYNGLTKLSPEIGAFYKDALMIMGDECSLSTKVNLVAHLSREIDGGFRDIFAPKTPESVKESAKTKEGHKESIVKALGFENTNISKEWFSVANTFNKFAHRHGFAPRTFDEFKLIWDRYEKVLHILTGSAYAITDRIAHIVSFEVPTDHILGSLKQVMNDPIHQFQFFNSLKASAWLEPLFNNDIFANTTFPNPQNPDEWYQLRYLNHIAPAATEEQQKIIIKIIRNLQKNVIEGKTELIDYSISYLLEILAKLPNYVISKDDIEFLTFLNSQWAFTHKFFESNFTEEFLKTYLANGSKEGLLVLLPFCFSFSIQKENGVGFDELGISPQSRVFPNLSEPYLGVINQHIPEIVKLGGITLLEQLSVKLNELFIARPYELIEIPSIEPSEQSGMYSGDWEYSLVEFLTKSDEALSPEELKEYVSLLVQQDTVIHSRIAIHLIRLHFKALSPLFWAWINCKKLEVLFPIHELYLLISERFSKLGDDEFKRLLEWIENIVYENEHLIEGDRKDGKNLRVRKYLNAIKPENKDQQKLLASVLSKYQDENSYALEHPEFDGYSTNGYTYDFPEGANGLKEKTVEDQVAYLAEFIIPDHFNNIPMGLGMLMNNYIIDEPEKYLPKLDEMGKLPMIYLEQFISTFGYVMKNGALSDWEIPVDTFISWVVKNAKSGKMKIYDLASFMLQLSESNDLYQFSEKHLKALIDRTIHLLSQDGYKTLDHLSDDFVGFMLNDGNAKLFDALINFSRLWARLQPAGAKSTLQTEVKGYLESNLARTSEKDKVFSIGLGMHFPFFYSADPDWCVSNKDKIFPEENELHFLYAINGLFSNRYQSNKAIIKYLYDYGLNSRIIEYFLKDSPQLNHLCRMALAEYFYIDPSVIDNAKSLLNLIIAKGHPVQFEKLINVTINLERGAILPVKELWQRILEKCLENPEKLKETLKNLVLLSDNFKELKEEEIQLIEACLPYLDGDRPSYMLIRNLLRFSETAPEKASELLLKIWKQTQIRPYVNDELQQFVQALYLKGMDQVADEICLYVASLGNLALKTVYDNYHLDQFN